MRDSMAHRGPDGAGVWISADRRVGLGHRRLAIIDLSDAASQPMCNEDGSLWIVFNGEIYNHAELRRELQATGRYKWKTDHSDTEVILHAFKEWGIDCLQRFRGMFAIALWDVARRELWLIRDRIGVKPLYYSIHDGRIVFASEIKALLKDPAQRRAVNEAGLFHYLSFLTVPAPETLFEGVHKLPGGTWMRVRADGRMDECRYWDVWDHTEPLIGVSDDEIAERLLLELRTAVQLRKVSDVPVGVFLSGGIDSSTNTALFSEGESRKVRTFSVGYDGKYLSNPSELGYAELVARRFGTDHHTKILSMEDIMSFLPEMARLQDEPIADAVCAPLYYVSKLARDNGVVVCQVGEGADELFWGYPKWKWLLRIQNADDWPVPRVLKRCALRVRALTGRKLDFPSEWLRRGAGGIPIFWGGAEGFTEIHKQQLLSARMRASYAGRTSWEALAPIRSRFQEAAWESSHLNWMTYLDLNLRLPELLLMRVDKMSMAVSLEGRVPFLDHKFVEFAMSIPSSVKTRNGTLKHILKKAVRGVIPDEVIDRKKQGFGVPTAEWFGEGLGDYAHRELRSFCSNTDLLNWPDVERLLTSGRRSIAWPLLNLALWWKAYFAS
jgi:asparagine synthase (glutamine-hydrolysing)